MRINGEAVRILRERSGYSISELGRMTGIDRSAVTRIEAGERRGTPAQAKAFATALKVPIVMLIVSDPVAETESAA